MPEAKPKSRTDWERVKREAEADAYIPFHPEDELYDPNDDAAAEAFFARRAEID